MSNGVHSFPRASYPGGRLARLLAELHLLDGQPDGDVAERLARLFDLSDTVALDTANAHRATGPFHASERDYRRLGEDLAKVRDKLLAGLTRAFEPEQLGTRNGLPAPQADYEPYQKFYVARQRQLTAGLQPVRVRLRGALADCGPGAARLAELDAVFDATLTAWTRRCFGAVPKLLARRFEALKPDGQRSLLDNDADDPDAWMAPGGWLHRFCQEMQLLLLAELEARLEPPLGLLDALHNEVRDRT
ncbi:DUF3348 family protein [Alloalcanivorax sp. C16-2]|uniref:DUF3348 family protein n=1 Tax=Alloalcanivorax TaxID=3020832 RepID=UPI001934323B|nr:DUF3348 family protein [Alloalcanivorax marinus]MBL7252213.1 DUF3348 family protein [Alloalcanivorax marinus]